MELARVALSQSRGCDTLPVGRQVCVGCASPVRYSRRGLRAIAAALVVAGCATGVASAASDRPAPATIGAAIVLRPGDVTAILHEPIVRQQVTALNKPMPIHQKACVGIDSNGVGAGAYYVVKNHSTNQLTITSTVIIRPSAAEVRHDFAIFHSAEFPRCDYTGNPAFGPLRIAQVPVSLPGTSETVGWRLTSTGSGPPLAISSSVFGLGRDEIYLTTLGTALPPANAPRSLLRVLLARAEAQPH